ncbi:MAG: HAMP domain-containing histidine kinase [Chromatiaceae bacterium]|nr:HAMP domain-containing histidine kinase [Chromatiaceae bacterium]
MDNAVRYTPRRQGDSRRRCCRKWHGWRSPTVVRGIAAADRERVFDRFHRGRGEQAMGKTGSGLGLSIVKRVAVMHGASIELGSGLDGRGLGVRIGFPLP